MRYVDTGDGPDGLDATDAEGATELDRARQHFVTNGLLNDFDFKAYKKTSVRNALRSLFNGKCAYCEFVYDVGYTEDIEHYRPKARIDVVGAAGVTSIHPGYWWLGSSWANLLPSCKRCNVSKWLELYDGRRVKAGKGNLFPLADETTRANVENGETAETALLLNPNIDDPADYLTFSIVDERCLVVPKGQDQASLEFRRAQTSIDIYGLNRQPLVKQRTERYIELAAAITNLVIIIQLYDRALPEERAVIDQRLRDEKARIAKSFAGDAAHSAMAAWLSEPILQLLGTAAP